ncbi:hypothetical protein P9112_009762 [Eukaryota sp. TZLM1-RC]
MGLPHPSTSPHPLSLPFPPSMIAAGDQHTLVLSRGGLVYGFGRNHVGQLGLGFTSSMESNPRIINSLSNIIKISCGVSHSLALSSDGAAFAWGVGIFLGLGGRDSYTPTELEDFHIVDIACTQSFHSLMVDIHGDVFGFGVSSGFGELGEGEPVKEAPVKVFDNTLRVFTCLGHSFFLTTDGTLYGSGANVEDQFCLGHEENVVSPIKIPVESVIHVSCHVGITLYLTSQGDLYSCGGLLQGREGAQSKGRVMIDNVSKATVDDTRALAITKDGRLFQWSLGELPSLMKTDFAAFDLFGGWYYYFLLESKPADILVGPGSSGSVFHKVTSSSVSTIEFNDDSLGDLVVDCGFLNVLTSSDHAFDHITIQGGTISFAATPIHINSFSWTSGTIIGSKLFVAGNITTSDAMSFVGDLELVSGSILLNNDVFNSGILSISGGRLIVSPNVTIPTPIMVNVTCTLFHFYKYAGDSFWKDFCNGEGLVLHSGSILANVNHLSGLVWINGQVEIHILNSSTSSYVFLSKQSTLSLPFTNSTSFNGLIVGEGIVLFDNVWCNRNRCFCYEGDCEYVSSVVRSRNFAIVVFPFLCCFLLLISVYLFLWVDEIRYIDKFG